MLSFELLKVNRIFFLAVYCQLFVRNIIGKLSFVKVHSNYKNSFVKVSIVLDFRLHKCIITAGKVVIYHEKAGI